MQASRQNTVGIVGVLSREWDPSNISVVLMLFDALYSKISMTEGPDLSHPWYPIGLSLIKRPWNSLTWIQKNKSAEELYFWCPATRGEESPCYFCLATVPSTLSPWPMQGPGPWIHCFCFCETLAFCFSFAFSFVEGEKGWNHRLILLGGGKITWIIKSANS